MRVVAHNPFVDAALVQQDGAQLVGLGELLDEADHVSLHARATSANRGMLGRDEFARMKRGAFFINTARDILVDEDALFAALDSGHLGGAALDVASPAPAGHPHRLLAFPTVLLLPHIGGATYETLANGGRMAAAEIDRFATGRPLVNLANPAVLDRAGAPT
jgi:D-3-phosphoglycerate dehydrogenase